MAKKEKRGSRRIPVHLKVAFKQVGRPGQSDEDVITNVSAGGVYIRTESAVAVGTLLDLEIKTGEPGGEGITMRAEVMHAYTGDSAGLGLRFVDSDPRELLRLLRMVLEDTQDLPDEEITLT